MASATICCLSSVTTPPPAVTLSVIKSPLSLIETGRWTMTHEHPFRDLLHGATHRVPGVPAHVDRPAGHQGGTHHSITHNHSSTRPPRVLVAWQRRIAALF